MSPSARVPRLLDALVAVISAVAVWRAVRTVLEAPRHTFAETRLMPLFRALELSSPFAAPGDGACYLPMYPPLGFLAYAPATLFLEPASVLRAGAAISLLAVLLPFALLARLASGSPDALSRVALGLSALVLLVHVSPVLVSAVFVHADAPSVGLVLLGALPLALGFRRDDQRLLVLSALVLSLAPWAKHTLAPVLLLPALALASRREWRRSAAHLALAAGFQAAWAVLFAALFGGAGLRFWLLEFPALHPWLGEPLPILALSSRVLLSMIVVEAAVLAGAAIALSARLSLARDWARHPWCVLAVGALLLWPTSLLGYVKVGGALNSFLPTALLLAGALLLLPIDRMAGVELPSGAPAGALLVAATLLGGQVAFESAVSPAGADGRNEPESSIAYQTLRTNPDEFLFPWFPMSTHLATGRFAHSELGIRERELGGLTVTSAQLRAGLPPRLRWIVCGKDPCESTLAHFRVIGRRTLDAPSGAWTIHEVAPLGSR